MAAELSRDNDVAKAMEYMLKLWPAFTRFLDDGRICLSNNAAERALRGIALGRKSWLSPAPIAADSGRPLCILIVTAKMNDVHRLGWPTCSLGSPSIPSGTWISFCLGIGSRSRKNSSLDRRCLRLSLNAFVKSARTADAVALRLIQEL
jgi:hypothetical protein